MQIARILIVLMVPFYSQYSFAVLENLHDPKEEKFTFLQSKGIVAPGHNFRNFDQEILRRLPRSLDSFQSGLFISELEKSNFIPTLLESVIKLNSHLNNEDHVIFLGRSGEFIRKGLSEYRKAIGKSSRFHYQVNFSAAPDTDISKNEREIRLKENLLDLEHLTYFQNYLRSMGLDQIKSPTKLLIVDVIASGAGLNSFLRILNDFYFNKLHYRADEVPVITFIALNLDPSHNISLLRRTGHYDSDLKTTTFYKDEAKTGMKHMRVTTLGLNIPKSLNLIMRAPDIQNVYCNGVYFPAYKWKKSTQLTNPNFAAIRAVFDHYFKEKINKAIKETIRK